MPDSRPTAPRAPDADDAVQRLLAQARHDDPVPDDVAQRLDRVLAGLRSEPAAAAAGADDGGETPVASLDAHRHRRAAVRVVVAAAAVLVVGIGVAHVIGDRDRTPDATTSVQRQPRSTPTPSGSAGASTTPAGKTYVQVASDLPVRLRSGSLDADVQTALALVAQLEPGLPDDALVATALGQGLRGWTCGTDTSTSAYGRGTLLPATYDGDPVVLAVRPASSDGRPARAVVLACGSGAVVQTSTVDPT